MTMGISLKRQQEYCRKHKNGLWMEGVWRALRRSLNTWESPVGCPGGYMSLDNGKGAFQVALIDMLEGIALRFP
jgi:hypothetical protein